MSTNSSEVLNSLLKARQKKLPKPKKAIAKVSAKKQAEIEANKELAKLDEAFYLEVWNAAPHRCYECNDSLGKVPANWMFHHLLPKSRFPQFRHTHENIALVCLTCHSKCETNIDFAPHIKKMAEQVKLILLH